VSDLPGVSIIVPNYNYERYIGAAIESALAQDHPNCEVIVVDDCSTDGSRAVIERYTDRVRSVLLPQNGGQIAAISAGWPLARYDILIFLDSDDLLLPHAASTVARAWSEGVTKVQFPMITINAEGRPIGHVAPKYPAHLDTQMIREFILKAGASPSTPGTGNAYAKGLLEKVSPIDDAEGVGWMDPVLETNAPFYGEVITLREPLAQYRMHDANNYQRQVLSADQFVRYVNSFDAKLAYVQRRCEALGLSFDPEAAKYRSIWYLECEMSASKLLPRDDPRRVPPLQIIGRAFRALPQSPYDLKRRAALMSWLTAVAFAPPRLAEELIAYRHIVARRPRWLERVIRIVTT
jgi:glycosyltransferase involved in cell wall biosynthesis